MYIKLYYINKLTNTHLERFPALLGDMKKYKYIVFLIIKQTQQSVIKIRLNLKQCYLPKNVKNLFIE